MALVPRIGKGWDPVTKVFVLFAFVGSFVYLACMANDTVNTWVKDATGISIQGP